MNRIARQPSSVAQTFRNTTPAAVPKKAAAVRQAFSKDEMSSGAGRALRARTAQTIGTPLPRKTEDEQGASGTVKVKPGSVDANATVKGKGWEVSFGTKVTATTDVSSKGGVTTITQEGSVSVTIGGKVEGKIGGFGAEGTTGVKTTYQVQLPDAAYQAGAKPDPFNPSTLPVGSVVLMNSSDFEGTAFEASYKQISISTKSLHEEGVSTTIEKTGENTVRVTVGPTELVQDNFELGVSLGPASVSIGNERKDTSFTMQTAEFDISTQEGLDAYNAFLATGKMPTTNSKGISGVATISKDTSDASVSVGAEVGPWSGSTTIASESYSSVVTTYPDGSKDRTIDAKSVSGSPLHATVHYRPDGTIDASKTTFSFFFKDASGHLEETLARVFGVDKKSAQGSKDFELTFTAEQAGDLITNAAAYNADRIEQSGDRAPAFLPATDYLLYQLSIATNPQEVAEALADADPGVIVEAMLLLEINGADAAGSISVRVRNA